MAMRAAMIGALCLLGCVQSPPPGPVAALQAVLAYEASFARLHPICVPAGTQGLAFDRDREEFRRARHPGPNDDVDVARRRQRLAAHEHPAFDWEVPAAAGGRGENAPPPPLDRALAAELSAVAGRVVMSDPDAVAPIALEPLPPPLRRPPGCGTSLSLTAPAFADDLAFVESSSSCGPLCGSGMLYALRRHGGEWRLIAVAHTWIA
jgi:hypothetical protein